LSSRSVIHRFLVITELKPKTEKQVAAEVEAPAQKTTSVEVQSSSTVEAAKPKSSTESVEEEVETTIELKTKKSTEKAKAGTRLHRAVRGFFLWLISVLHGCSV
jgi:hypothetical protein